MHDFPVFPRAARVVALSALLGLPLTSGAAGAGELTVFAAASMKTAMDEVEAGWEAATGHELTVSYAGSSALARQIERGAPADVFISANPGWMDHLEAVGRIDPGTRFDLLGNRIVLIAHGQDAGGVRPTTSAPRWRWWRRARPRSASSTRPTHARRTT